MPIIELPTLGTPLSQGDILKGIPVYLSKRGADAHWEPGIDKKKLDLCLVLSRQCVVEHKKTLTVAFVDKYSGTAPIPQDFKSALSFLMEMRDGNAAPDLFYLGQLPGADGRFCARLDFLGTIEIPQKPDDRQKFIDEYRVARLNKDYVRDLHLRVFQAFASMGYEDYQWVSDADLKWLLQTGKEEIVNQQQRLASNEAARSAGGNPPNGGEANRIADIKKRMEPYQKELDRRYPPPPEPAVGESKAPEAAVE